MSSPSWRDDFLRLTPVNLLITGFLLFWGNGVFSNRLIKTALIVFGIGFFIEVIGVKTGALFGEYYYGNPLGLKLFEVPLIIGVNWLVLSFSSTGIACKIFKSKMLQIVASSFLLVALDFLIEPVAVKLDFWTWIHGDIPIKNYLMWFVTGLLVNGVVIFCTDKIHFRTSLFVFFTQVYFFALLNIL